MCRIDEGILDDRVFVGEVRVCLIVTELRRIDRGIGEHVVPRGTYGVIGGCRTLVLNNAVLLQFYGPVRR